MLARPLSLREVEVSIFMMFHPEAGLYWSALMTTGFALGLLYGLIRKSRK